MLSNACGICSKKYKNKTQLQKHFYLCRLLHSSKTMDVMDDIPSHRSMYIMLLELGNKYNSLEEKYNTLLKQQPPMAKVNKKKDFLHWLNATKCSAERQQYSLTSYIETYFTTTIPNIERLFVTSFIEVLDTALSEMNFNTEDCPIICHKNIIYGYERVLVHHEEEQEENNNNEKNDNDDECHWQWSILSKEKIKPILYKLKRRLFAVAYQHRIENADRMKEDEKFENQIDLMINKIVEIEISNDTTYNKMKKIFIKHVQEQQKE